MGRRLIRVGVLGAALSALLLGQIGSASADPMPGSVDTSYGISGSARLGVFPSVASNSRGAITAAGYESFTSPPGLVRLTANGALDATFGIGGHAPINSGGVPIGDRHVALQRDGSVIVATVDMTVFPPPNIVVSKTTATGAADTTFGRGGVVSYPASWFAYNEIRDAEVMNDGTVFVVGNQDSGATVVRRIDPDGSLPDASHPGRCARVPGVQTIPVNGFTSHVTSSVSSGDQVLLIGIGLRAIGVLGPSLVVLDHCGRVVASTVLDVPPFAFSAQGAVPTSSGWMVYGSGGVLEVDHDLRLVPSFGINGVVLWPAAWGTYAPGPSTVDPEGRVIARLSRPTVSPTGQSGSQAALLRMTAKGALDPSFGTGGFVLGTDTSGVSSAQLFTDARSRILVAGPDPSDPTSTTYVTRYNG